MRGIVSPMNANLFAHKKIPTSAPTEAGKNQKNKLL